MEKSFADRLALPGIVSCAGLYQMASFARSIGQARTKYKVSPPAIQGPPEFNRIFRAQQNALEFYPLSMAGLWLSSVFFHPVPASLSYLGYLYARNQYFKEYSKDPEKRLKPFSRGARFLQLLLLMSALGVGHKVIRYYGNGLDVTHHGKRLVTIYFWHLVCKPVVVLGNTILRICRIFV